MKPRFPNKDDKPDGENSPFNTERYSEGKSCDNCLHRDRCLYDHNPGKNFICWKRDPRVR